MPAVDVGEFWGLVGRAVREEPDRARRAGWIQGQLAAREVEEILDFEAHLDDASDRAMTWLMWGAAYRIFGGCSDDGFCYFRTWLMSLGRDAFERLVDDPDALALESQILALAGRERADWRADEWPEWEELNYAASEAFEGVRGHGANIYRAVEEHRREPRLQTLQDEHWNFDDPAETARRLPALARLFPHLPSEPLPPVPLPPGASRFEQSDEPSDEPGAGGPIPEIPGQLAIPGLPE
ncbi:DUF4240 domain-containing protein [Catellatospora sp. NPDC049133]|uniref:DUF4240 domain-containing protein n=1 Tax=Catellatospora sp. NPDC049133 TaxID=3155499 RepID=UPI0034115036